jgi:hypothetical protein
VVSLKFTPTDSLTNQTFVFDHRDLLDSDGIPNDANPNYDANWQYADRLRRDDGRLV